MSELEFERNKRRRYPSIYETDREFDLSLEKERESQRRERTMRDLLNSNQPPEILGAKAVVAGLISFYQYEEIFYASEYKKRGGLAGLFFPKEEERTTKRHSRLILER
jgi:hypothetical protein